MQKINIDISDSGRIIIEDRVYYPANDSIDGMFQNENTNEKALLKKCTNQSVLDEIEAFEYEVLSAERNARGFRNIIYPRVFVQNDISQEAQEGFVLIEVPEKFQSAAIHRLTKALDLNGFSIYSRIMASIHLAEAFSVIQKYIGKNIFSLNAEDIYVNIENGEVYIWIEKWLRKVSEVTDIEGFGISPEWYSKEEKKFTEDDYKFFVAYTIFRILCNDDPFDGSETLLQFPLLTKEAINTMHAEKYGFALAKGNNFVSEYIGQGLWKKWRALPKFIRNEFEKTFTIGLDQPEHRTEIAKWLKIMQKIRDCLVYVNGQFKFCDPDVSNKVLFMIIDDYKIPVWPKKAIYWYHVDIPSSESKTGIVAGVTARDGHYYLNNLSGNVWLATLNNTSSWIHPEREVEIVEGMTIKLENDKVITVINGLVDNTAGEDA